MAAVCIRAKLGPKQKLQNTDGFVCDGQKQGCN